MIFADTYKPEFQSMRALLLEVAQERSVEALLNLIVHRLARRPHIALARIWLIRPGDLCETCPRFKACPDQINCLHLVAGAGSPVAHNADAWSHIDDDHQRRPLGLHKIGHITVSGEPVRMVDTNKDPDWI